MRKLTVYIATHPSGIKHQPNPSLNPNGEKEALGQKYNLLKIFYCEDFKQINAAVGSGLGKRQQESANIISDGEISFLDERLGVSEYSPDKKRIIFSNGNEIPIEEYMNSERFKKIFQSIPEFIKEQILKVERKGKNLILVTGRIVPLALKVPREELKSGAIYKVWLTNEGRIAIKEISF